MAGPFARTPRRRLPRIHWGSVAAVAVGGFFGGLARYGIGLSWPASAMAFPWATLVVNTSGAFVLAALLVLVLEVAPPTTYLRPALGTGFLGAYTTFSSVVTSADRLGAHGHAGLAVGYVAASLAAGIAAVMCGIIVARSVGRARRRE